MFILTLPSAVRTPDPRSGETKGKPHVFRVDDARRTPGSTVPRRFTRMRSVPAPIAISSRVRRLAQ